MKIEILVTVFNKTMQTGCVL